MQILAVIPVAAQTSLAALAMCLPLVSYVAAVESLESGVRRIKYELGDKRRHFEIFGEIQKSCHQLNSFFKPNDEPSATSNEVPTSSQLPRAVR